MTIIYGVYLLDEFYNMNKSLRHDYRSNHVSWCTIDAKKLALKVILHDGLTRQGDVIRSI